MSEQLYIRLGSQYDDNVHWLVWSESENEIIASGVLPDAGELSSLQSRAGRQAITVFVSGHDVLTKQVEMPAKSGRQFIQALPYMLEDELAQDVDTLFFAPGDKIQKGDATYLNVAICSKAQMDLWLSWLNDAELVSQRIVPDYLALPKDEGLSAIQIDNDWLIKSDTFSGFIVNDATLTTYLNMLPKSEEEAIKLEHYSPIPESAALPAHFSPEAKTYDLPLQVLAAGLGQTKFNLRQGVYQLKKNTWKFVSAWRNVAILTGVLFSIHLVGQGIKIVKLEAQSAVIDKQIRQTFLTAFPTGGKIKSNGMKKYIKSKMKDVAVSGEGDQFFPMLADTMAVFSQVPALSPLTLRFDAGRAEIRIQAQGNNFANFESFKVKAGEQGLKVEQGSLNNTDGKVSGSLSIKGA
ncbi:type II secretion system protein GspL [Algibacillus agarilyticus]|uniref:type II secretion system protein GspL n=1 Tax=Algibacillus agarilyticus TaxID=2234133 RepID=UPI0013003143|nr:type II secretion system protein GspL [Algibacillus agarilyticus]